ncbi:hypothetical protein CspeluHIS016_0207180 [Cutaneotrichosporon spelunceum]|uniref:SET domain-containing protein n=1 Tax=Cutaneotrichosporon spelunceum TaxID=1672016 RepID=A0AAD3TSF2_9TREE|nr:hypothetical protein CspeluHIS016_0207180 [Cutaneotrichosporon spelunceum]
MARLGNEPPLGEPDAEPAEDLSGDDDLLNHILVNTIAQTSAKGIGLHPQTVGYVGPVVAYEQVLEILQRHVIDKGNIASAASEFLQWGSIKDHLETRTTNIRKGRFIKHLHRYLMIYGPTSRVEIFKTDRYKEVTLHDELGVYATRNLEEGAILDELQGSVVKFPKSWEADLERGRFRDGASDDELQSEEDQASDGEDDEDAARKRSRKVPAPQRRSERTGRRDFSVLRSSLKNCLQLFLGPARFLNHDCENNVELYRKDGYVTFKVLQPIKIGQELTTFYGRDYFGRGNRECMCLTCELGGNGYYKENPSKRTLAEEAKRTAAEIVTSRRPADSDDERDGDDTPFSTTQKVIASATDSMAASDDEESEEPERRLQPKRRAALKAKKIDWSFNIHHRRRGDRSEQDDTDTLADESESDTPGDAADAGRCLTCAAKTKSLWVRQQEFLLCQRCCRHAMIFLLPWPAHRKVDVREYPPPHLLPRKYYPPQRVSLVELPTYSAKPRAPQRVDQSATAIVANAKAQALLRAAASDIPDTKEHRRARHRSQETEHNDFDFDMAARSAWDKEEARREAQISMAKARERAKAQRAETRRKLDEGKQKGVGLWSRYTTETHEQREERERKKYQFVSGTRSGRKIREPSEDEAELERLTREAMLMERNRELIQSQKQREWREREKARRRTKRGRASDSEDNSDDELAELDELDDLEELNELGAAGAETAEASASQPDQSSLQGKLLLAGGEEGEDDEEAENEALGRQAGTGLDPIDLTRDEDEPGRTQRPTLHNNVREEVLKTCTQQAQHRRSSRPSTHVVESSDSDESLNFVTPVSGPSRPPNRRLDPTPPPTLPATGTDTPIVINGDSDFGRPGPGKSRQNAIAVASTSNTAASLRDPYFNDPDRGMSTEKAIMLPDSDDDEAPVVHPHRPTPEHREYPDPRARSRRPFDSNAKPGRLAPDSRVQQSLPMRQSPGRQQCSNATDSSQHQQANLSARGWRQERTNNLAIRAREQLELNRDMERLPLNCQPSRRAISEMSIDEASPQDEGNYSDDHDDHDARSTDSVEFDVGSSSRARPDELPSTGTQTKRRPYQDPLHGSASTGNPAKKREYQDLPSNENPKPRKKRRSFFPVHEDLKLPRVPPNLPAPRPFFGPEGFDY